jgi:hypothetical protein
MRSYRHPSWRSASRIVRQYRRADDNETKQRCRMTWPRDVETKAPAFVRIECFGLYDTVLTPQDPTDRRRRFSARSIHAGQDPCPSEDCTTRASAMFYKP